MLFKFRLRCITEDSWVSAWSEDEPTECPNNSQHSIDTTSVTIVEYESSKYIVTAGEDLGARKTVYISGSNEVKLACADSEDTLPCIGFTERPALQNDDVLICTNDILSGFSGLTPGGEYFLTQDSTAAGEITLIKPTSGIVISVGIAKTTTELDVHLLRLQNFFGEEYNYYYGSSEGESSTTSEEWQEKLDISPTGIPAGTYKVGWNFEWSFSRFTSPGANFGVHIDWGAITLTESEAVPSKNGLYGDGCFYSSSGFMHVDLDAGNHKVALNFHAGGGGSITYIRRARLEFRRKS
jgi:hypothetical protein